MSEPDARITALEEAVTHAERLLKDLNDVVCSMQDRLDRQDRKIEHLLEVSKRLEDSTTEKRSLEDDKPPHY